MNRYSVQVENRYNATIPKSAGVQFIADIAGWHKPALQVDHASPTDGSAIFLDILAQSHQVSYPDKLTVCRSRAGGTRRVHRRSL